MAILNEGTWSLFLQDVAHALLETHGLETATVVISPSPARNAFFIRPHPSVRAGLTYSYQLSDAHVNDLRITLSRSTPSSPAFDQMQGNSPHYNGGTRAYAVHGIRHAVETVIQIARETFVERQFPMDPMHRAPESGSDYGNYAHNEHFFSYPSMRKREERDASLYAT
jgi:hypothetical protein